MDEKKTPRRKYGWKPPIDRLDEVEALIAESGKSANAFLTQCVLEKRRSSIPLPLKHASAEAIPRLGKIKSLSRDFMSASDNGEPHPAHNEIHDLFHRNNELLLEIRTALFLILGRKP